MDLEFVVHLGDFIEREFSSFDVLNPIYDQLTMPKYHVLGNHDYSVADGKREDVPHKMGMSSRYYDFEVNGWRFIVLDGNDISYHAYPKGSEEYAEADEYYIQNNIQSPKWNGAIGTKQFSWLQTVLDKATHNKENVLLYCHFPVYPENPHNLWNADTIIRMIEAYPCVKAYINGHNHEGNYGTKTGIHFLTLKGMVDTVRTSYAVIGIKDDCIEVTGFGREESRTMKTRE
jgi:predicted phosphodiesterase